ncbi:MAG: hypothetical protein QOG86_2371 [Thermoleophilaceae bacterium]|jgi:hypothetical protein|nr:hypothetical protein [Thermoleophilaceae bacterium]
MRKTTAAIVTVVTGLVWSGAGLAAERHVPNVTNLRASPAKFCARKTDRCHHDGTHVRFSLSTRAKVRIDISERAFLNGPIVEFVGKLPKGKNDFYLHDKRLHTGWWTIRVQGTNRVGSGGVDTVKVHVVKHD